MAEWDAGAAETLEFDAAFWARPKPHLLMALTEYGAIALPRTELRDALHGFAHVPSGPWEDGTAGLALLELHLSDHKGFTQGDPELLEVCRAATCYMRLPLTHRGEAAASVVAGGAGPTVMAAQLRWHPTRDERDELLAGLLEALRLMAAKVFVRSGRPADGLVWLDS